MLKPNYFEFFQYLAINERRLVHVVSSESADALTTRIPGLIFLPQFDKLQKYNQIK